MSDSVSFLVVGADGMIGGSLAAALRGSGADVVATALQPQGPTADCLRLDITEPREAWPIPERVATAYLLAAIPSLDACRHDPQGSRLINVERTLVMARHLVERGARIIFPSTNLVFDGEAPGRRAEDPVAPRTEYGRQKAEAERQLLALGDRVTIVRLTKVVAPAMPLLARWRQALLQGETIRPFTDMVMAPIPLSFVVTVLRAAGAMALPGILQVSADRDVTYAEAAAHVAGWLGVSGSLIQPMPSSAAGLDLEAVPRHTTLDTSRLRQSLGLQPPDVWTALVYATGEGSL
jgi:dTDP-4-dehydrorhamnose reductase